MFKHTLRAAFGSLGFTIHRLPSERVLPLDYPVRAIPRWGHGRETHPRITALLERDRSAFAEVLRDIAAQESVFRTIPHGPDERAPAKPFWDNSWFPPLDAAALVGLLLSRRPKTYLEIGSGNSTKFARHAIAQGGLDTKIVSIDPHPRAEIDAICDAVVRTRLEECDAGVLSGLQAGDILFFDGSHRAFTNSDVTAFFFDFLPTLGPGILVHIHDIFWPADYPLEWRHRYYNEQYVLGMALLCPDPSLRVVLPNFYVATDPELRAILAAVPAPSADAAKMWLKRAGMLVPACSFWVETR